MQAEMNKLFAEGGVLQQGGTVDPVSGNEVPPGAMAEEVRDDIDAKLSEGEFVIPADVVRYIGLEKLMMMRDKAKAGLKKMAEIGQMGNAEEVPDGEALHGAGDDEEMDDDSFSSEIDSILGEDDGGGEKREYAEGGYVVPDNQRLYRDAPIKGFEMVPMTNDAGQTIYIPFINGVAQLSIPSGYKAKTAGVGQAPDATPSAGVPAASGDTGTGGDVGIGSDGGGIGGGNTDGSSKGGGQGVSNSAISASLSAMAFGQSTLGKAMSAVLGVPASTIASFGGKLGADAQLDALGKASDALSQDTLSGQLATVSDESGNISTLSNDSITNAYDMATFGTTSQGLSAESAGYAAADAVGAEGLGVGNIGAESAGYAAADAVGAEGLGVGGFGGGDASGGYGAADGVGSDGMGMGGFGGADAGGAGTGGGDSGGSDGGGMGGGMGWAKGGFVSKRNSKKTNKSTSLASRRK